MATIKSYTSVEQGKKLAKILPLESADMCYCNDGNANEIAAASYENASQLWDDYYDEIIPCWSLAALLSLIPQEIFDGEYIINITEGRDNKWIITYDYYENRSHSYYGLSAGADNLVDACTDIIIKLKERNII